MARDSSGLYVVIEIKKSDKTARELVHEMSKYIVRLRDEEHIGGDEIRCIALSTDWHELLEAYSFFSIRTDIDAIGFEITRGIDGLPVFNAKELLALKSLPSFSPEFSIYYYESQAQRESHLDHVTARIAQLPFLRVAMVLLDAMQPTLREPPCIAIACAWRIDEKHFDEIERIGNLQIGNLWPYAFPGWETECDVLYWAVDEEAPSGISVMADDSRGTAEKVVNLLQRYTLTGARRIGDWQGADLTDDRRILDLLHAEAGRLPIARGNRYAMSTTIDPRRKVAWETELQRLLQFIGYVDLWHQEIVAFGNAIGMRPDCCTVRIKAQDSRHFFYRVHQAVEYPQAHASYFTMQALDDLDQPICVLVGFWSWDGKTCPRDAVAEIERIYGDLGKAVMLCFNAVDESRYDDAYRNHGFEPAIIETRRTPSGEYAVRVLPELTSSATIFPQNGLEAFVTANRQYAESISQAMCSLGYLPRNPHEGT